MATSNRMSLYREQRGRCHYCDCHMSIKPIGRVFVTEDHIIPRSQGGTSERKNIVGACNTCNNLRGSIEYNAFVRFIKKHGNRTPIKQILRFLTSEEYQADKEMYEAVRRGHNPGGEMYIKPKPTTIIATPAPVVTRRKYLVGVRCEIAELVLRVPYSQRKQLCAEQGIA